MVNPLLFKYMLTPLDYSIVKFTTFADTSAVAQVRDLAESVHFEKGAVIESRGKPTDHIYLIDEGMVQLGVKGVDGSQFNLARLGPGHTFGESEIFLNLNVIHDATAESDVVVQKLSRANVDQLKTSSLSFSKALMAVSCIKVQTMLTYIGDTLGMPLLARVAQQTLSVSEGVDNTDLVHL